MISIIVPVFNTADYLERCLDSILQNSYTDIEVICVDDGSKDQSPRILERYVARDPRIRVITQPNQGVAAARNTGLAAVKGDFVTFIDSDDCVHPDFFKCLMAALTDAACPMAVSPLRSFQKAADLGEMQAAVTAGAYEVNDLSTFLQDPFLKSFGAGKLYRRDLLQGKHFHTDAVIGEDVLFLQDVLFFSPRIRIAVLKEGLYFYYERENSAAHVEEADAWINLLRVYLSRYDAAASDIRKRFYLEELARRYSFVRYYIYPYRPGTITAADLKQMEKEILLRLRRDHSLKLSRRLAYSILTAFPETYRRFRKLRRSKWYKRLMHVRRK